MRESLFHYCDESKGFFFGVRYSKLVFINNIIIYMPFNGVLVSTGKNDNKNMFISTLKDKEEKWGVRSLMTYTNGMFIVT